MQAVRYGSHPPILSRSLNSDLRQLVGKAHIWHISHAHNQWDSGFLFRLPFPPVCVIVMVTRHACLCGSTCTGHTRGGPRLMLTTVHNLSYTVVSQTQSLHGSLLLVHPSVFPSLPPKAALTPHPPDIFCVFLRKYANSGLHTCRVCNLATEPTL